MRCDICREYEECEILKEFKYITDRMDIKEYGNNFRDSLCEDLYILIARYCEMYSEEQKREVKDASKRQDK